MKKWLLGSVIAVTIIVALLSAGYVFAQSTSPTPQPGSGFGRGRGMMGGGMMGYSDVDAAGPMHDAMIAVFAQKLGTTVDDLNARLARGETMAQIAAAKGLTTEEFFNLMKDARSQAIDQAVKNGTLTQAQADWMKQRGAGMMGANGTRGGRGMMGGYSNNSPCPYVNQGSN
jgi:hypothetical protein